MSIVNGYEIDVILQEEDRTLRVLVVNGVTIWFLDEQEIFSTDWGNTKSMFQSLIDDVEG